MIWRHLVKRILVGCKQPPSRVVNVLGWRRHFADYERPRRRFKSDIIPTQERPYQPCKSDIYERPSLFAMMSTKCDKEFVLGA